ncbi:MAG: YidB family protein [Pseudomonadota bacterium]
MDLKNMAVELLKQRLTGGSSNDDGLLGAAVGSLLGGGDDNDVDLAGLVGKFSGGDIGGALQSWLGDGDNDNVNGDQVAGALGMDQVAQFAQRLGIGEQEAADGLSDVLPQLIDKNSQGGDLLGGLAGLASKFLK